MKIVVGLDLDVGERDGFKEDFQVFYLYCWVDSGDIY